MTNSILCDSLGIKPEMQFCLDFFQSLDKNGIEYPVLVILFKNFNNSDLGR